ncbi:alpha/beta hydrolase [Actinoallomurus bryophytorum]|uniref:Pimeloyl-ACP methyl ester carboxylesterase n=1 Tax=Actinoallomurus bryophytorum TaxID=1490222 RepID=A0A543CDI3_9ACTN|nr:alpha/beta hydrolase [Actinoallomurus bryophytorum]TQL95080.1 pimeloyl-ACP methyl ester carboxylesterase [Actinoallomurus bryophytorum]
MGPVPATPLSTGAHTVEVGGVALRYHVSGTGPVCLAHPGGPGIWWDYLRMPAVEQHLTMVYVEPIGTGESGRLASHPHGYTRERYAQALDRLIAHLGVRRVHLLGHSHGGFVTQHYALKYADRLAGIILYDSAPLTGPEQFADAAARMEGFAAAHADAHGLPDVLDAWRSVPTISDDEAMTAVVQRLFPAYFADYWGREEEFAAARTAVRGTYISGFDERMEPVLIDDRELLGSVMTPTLVIVGRHDFICGPRWADELHEGIPSSELVVLEDSGHFGHLEEPDVFARAVAGFVASTAGA